MVFFCSHPHTYAAIKKLRRAVRLSLSKSGLPEHGLKRKKAVLNPLPYTGKTAGRSRINYWIGVAIISYNRT